ncbi:MAG: prolipoprotein diacylglyceryl transferase [Chloroflexi bacterium]|nr:prolipoprotein diacylglyceryl transferase [Chloroflexota bacterium]
MIRVGLDPMIVHLGPFTLTWYGLAIFAAVVVAVALVVRWAKQRGIPSDWIYNVAMWGIVGGIIGARLFTLIDTFDYYVENPMAIFALWEGGLAIFGAILGGFAGGVLCCWRKGYPVGQIADLAAPGLITAQAIGRLGCIVNGDAYGAPTTLPFAIVYTNPNNSFAPLGVPTHATPIYEIVWDLLVLGVLLKLRGRLKPDGALFAAYLGMYSLGRFFISFFRENVPVLAGLNAAQVIALVALGVAVFFLAFRARLVSPTQAPAAGEAQAPEVTA